MLTINELEELFKGTGLVLKDEESPDEPRFQMNGKGVDLSKSSLYLAGRVYDHEDEQG